MLAVSELRDFTTIFRNEFTLVSVEVQRVMLTFIELNLNWIVFTIQSYHDMANLTIVAMNQLHDDIDDVKDTLRRSSSIPVDEDQVNRIESHFQDILEALKHCIQRRNSTDEVRFHYFQLSVGYGDSVLHSCYLMVDGLRTTKRASG